MGSRGTGRDELCLGATLVLLSRDLYLTADQELEEWGYCGSDRMMVIEGAPVSMRRGQKWKGGHQIYRDPRRKKLYLVFASGTHVAAVSMRTLTIPNNAHLSLV